MGLRPPRPRVLSSDVMNRLAFSLIHEISEMMISVSGFMRVVRYRTNVKAFQCHF